MGSASADSAVTAARHSPLLVYDGECGFCVYSVDFWRQQVGDAVTFRPYQEAATGIPDISAEKFRQAIYWFGTDGGVCSGAAAAFEVAATSGRPLARWLYRHVPGFAAGSEASYRFVAARRGLALRVSRVLWGRPRHVPRYRLAAWSFQRALALIFLAAFLSLGTQITGLVGADGILPLAGYLAAVHEHYGASAWWQLPTVFWLASDDRALLMVTGLGAAAALAALAGIGPRLAFALCYAAYLSLFCAGQAFMTFQWDLLLLEAGFLAILLTPASRLVPFLYRLLLFRFVFLAGAAKLLSHDPTWRDRSALSYHFETQPLPTPLAWWFDALPAPLLQIGVTFTLVVELILPLLFFAPRLPRMFAALALILFELLIIATGNYNFFNLLTIALALFLFEDRDLARLLPRRLSAHVAGRWNDNSFRHGIIASLLAALIVALGAAALVRPFAGTLPAPVARVEAWFSPLRLASGYGLFAVMTTRRTEIVIEGSADGRAWQEYRFRYKPDDPAQRPTWIIPHQPRLDWQMWFAALGSADQNPWFGNLMYRLLFNEAAVTALLSHNPFTDSPPRFVRALSYEYRFSDPGVRTRGIWWQRRQEGIYYPAIGFKTEVEPVRSEP
ncbi:MAG: lipase maturation factor family protein [Gammaproteobacteria bacterium]|nr:lipase maturation factor family protein [Gammaproteobacteria bacterium]